MGIGTDFANLVLGVDSTQVDKADKKLDNLNKTAAKTEKATDGMTRGFSSMASTLQTLAPVIAGTYATANIIRVARETEKYIAQLKTMTGGVKQAGIEFNRLNEFAKTTPFTLKQSIDGFVKLKALGLDPSERAMRSYGNTAASMGFSMTQMIEAVADASTNEFERLKAFGIKAKQQGDNVTFTFRGVETTIEKSSKNIQEYLLNIGETDFATGMADQANTIDTQLSNLTLAFDDLWRAIGEGLDITGIIKDLLASLSSVINSATKEVKEFFRALSINEYSDLISERDQITDSINAYNKLIDEGKTVNEGYILGINIQKERLKELNKLIPDLSTKLGFTKTATDELTNSNNNLSGSIKGVVEELDDMDRALDLIDAEFKKLDEQEAKKIAGIDTDEFRKAKKALKDLEKQNKTSTEAIESDWDRLNDNIQAEFIDTISDMIFEGEASFSDMFKSIGKMWANTWLNQAFNPRVTLTGGAGGAPGITSAITGGSGGFTDILSTGKTLWEGFSTASGAFGAFGTGAIGGAITPILNSALSGLGIGKFATTAMGPTLTGASLGAGSGLLGAIGGAMPYIGAGLALLNAFGVFDSESDVTPDLNLRANFGKDKFGAFTYQNNEAMGTLESQFGNISYGTQHDAFASEQDARTFADSLAASFQPFDQLISQAVGEEMSDQIIAGMKNVDEFIKVEEGSEFEGAMQTIFKNRFTRITDIIGGEFDQVFDMFEGDYKSGVLAASTYVTATDEVKTMLMTFWTDQKETVEELMQENETLATASIRLVAQLESVNGQFDMIGLSVLDITTESALLTNQLIDMGGGFDALTAKTNFFYQNYFSETERTQDVLNSTKDSIAKFNEEFGTSIFSEKELRATVEGLGTVTDSNVEFYNALLDLAPTMTANANATKWLADENQKRIDEELKAQEAVKKAQEEILKIEQERLDAALEAEQERLDQLTEEKRLYEEQVEAADQFADSMKELHFALKGETDLDKTIRQINEILTEFGFVGNHADYSADKLADFVITLDGMDQVTLDAEGSITNLANAMMHLDDIILDAQNTIDSILSDQYINNLNDQIALEQQRLDLANEAYQTDIDRYEATISSNKSIRDFLDSLKISELKPQSPLQQMNEAAELFNKAVTQGDSAKATQFGQEYLQFAQKYYASTGAYGEIYTQVTGALGGMIQDPGSPTGTSQGVSTSSRLSELEQELANYENQLRQDALAQQNIQLIEAFNTLALAKDVSLFEIARLNGIDLKDLGYNLIGSLETLNEATIDQMIEWAKENNKTSTDLANTAGIDYDTMILYLSRADILLKDIREWDKSIAGYTDLTYDKIIEIAKDQLWSTETLADKYGTTNDRVIDYLTSQGYTLESINAWNEKVADESVNTSRILATIDQSMLEVNQKTYDLATQAGYGGVYSDNQILQRIMDLLGGTGTAHLEYVRTNQTTMISKMNNMSFDSLITEIKELKEEVVNLKAVNGAGFKGVIYENKRQADAQEAIADAEAVS